MITVFKLFPRFGVDTFGAIVINYFVCVLAGGLYNGQLFDLGAPYMPYAFILGIIFISCFYAVGLTVRLFGITISSVLQKMSLLVSVPYAIIALKEPADSLKIIGLGLAFAAVLASNWPEKLVAGDSRKQERQQYLAQGGSLLLLWFFPIYSFSGSGLIEVLLQYVQQSILGGTEEESAAFTTAIFASAGLLGAVVYLYQLLTAKARWSWKNVGGGIALGIPNYFSIVFLLLAFKVWDKSVVLPINNISIVVATALLGLFFFRERLSKINYIGVLLAIFAILLMAYSQ
ncbi:putative membrane protein [Saprospira grandis DSM 2844]|uniref:Putative membrane protein n=1 Tax=Saprospira grandis DSM 2844 TaxID=694433 RepID=J1I215_9BACT|nr:putative membrane protein [Saprospira grandis DSM 2844]